MGAESEWLRSMRLMNRLSCLFVAGLLVLLAVPAAAQSFNCHKAFFADERTICEAPPLGRLDSGLAGLFGHVISRLPPSQRAALKREETGWVVARRRCGDDGRCIAGFYRRRIQQLDRMLAANEPEGIGSRVRHSLRTRTQSEPVHPERNLAARPPAHQPPNTPASGSTTPVPATDLPAVRSTPPVPATDLDVEPEISPRGQGRSDGSAGGPMTPVR
jgi:uncharacterized protein